MNMLRKLSTLRYSVELVSVDQQQIYFRNFVQHIFTSASKNEDDDDELSNLSNWLSSKLQLSDIQLIYGYTQDHEDNYYEVITTGYLRQRNIYYLTRGNNRFIYPHTKYTFYSSVYDVKLTGNEEDIITSLSCIFIQNPSIPNSLLYMQDNVQFDRIYLGK